MWYENWPQKLAKRRSKERKDWKFQPSHPGLNRETCLKKQKQVKQTESTRYGGAQLRSKHLEAGDRKSTHIHKSQLPWATQQHSASKGEKQEIKKERARNQETARKSNYFSEALKERCMNSAFERNMAYMIKLIHSSRQKSHFHTEQRSNYSHWL